MCVPEATMYENHNIEAAKYQVRSACKSLRVQTIPEARVVQQATHKYLGLSILAFDAGHHPAARFPVDNVDHQRRISASALMKWG